MGAAIALAFLFISPPASAQVPAAASVNLLTNGTFEKGAEGWVLSAHEKKGQMAMDATELHNGKPSLRIDNAEGDDTFAKQKVTVKPNTRYRIAGYIKTKAVQTLKRDGKDGRRCPSRADSPRRRQW